MASYKPKSLDELNSQYGKTLETKKAIETEESVIASSNQPEVPSYTADLEELLTFEESTVSQSDSEELTKEIEKFIENFGKHEEEQPVPPRPTATKRTYIAPPKPTRPARSVLAAEAPVAPAEPEVPKPQSQPQRSEKPEFVMSAEREELFDEYMKIMSDDDDDSFLAKSKARKKKKSKKYEGLYSDGEEEALPLTQESAELNKEEKEEHDSDISSAFYEKTELPVEEAAEEKNDDSFISDEYEADENEITEEPVPEKKKNVAVQILLIVLLLSTLLSALLVTVLQTVFKVDTGEAFAGGYYFYTVDETDSVVGLTEGDLVIAQQTGIAINEPFAYIDRDSKDCKFAVKTFTVSDTATIGENGNGLPVSIFNTDIRGKLIWIQPGIGKLVATVCDNFFVVISGLVALAVILILILAFAFGRSSKKGKKDEDDFFSFDEEEEEGYTPPEDDETELMKN